MFWSRPLTMIQLTIKIQLTIQLTIKIQLAIKDQNLDTV
jgi:hypothetical protein